MFVKNRKISYFCCFFAIALSFMFLLSSCIPSWKWDFTNEKGYYQTQSGDIIMDFRSNICSLKISEEKTYHIALHNALTVIYLYLPQEEVSSGASAGDILTFSVIADKNDQTLHLTVTESQIEGLVGNEYDLSLIENAEVYTGSSAESTN